MKEYFHGVLELVKKGSRLDRVVVLFFLAATIIYGGTKSPTNSPPSQGTQPANSPPHSIGNTSTSPTQSS